MAKIEFSGVHLDILLDQSPERLIEGSLSSGKTTVALWAELEALKNDRGIWILLTRWTDDAVKTLLRPAFEQLARIHGTKYAWNNSENCYEIDNGSRAFAFGLKTQSSDPLQKYSKIRGLPVSRILFDQAEQGQGDVFAELRFRLRPDIEARLRGQAYRTQLTLVANPVNDSHPLAVEFPTTKKLKGRTLFSLSIFDNQKNLPTEMVESLLQLYPPDHPLYATRILGQRGLTVVGDAVFENLYDRSIHAVDPLDAVPGLGLIEAFELGQHNPAWVIGQRTFHGALHLLGGVLAKRMMLEDFLPIVRAYRDEWFPGAATRTCTSPMGAELVGERYTLLQMLRESGYKPISQSTANAHDVELATIEQIGSLLRRRTMAHEEALKIAATPSRWLYVSPDGSVTPKPFLSFAFDGGFVWDSHTVSVSNASLRQAFDDGEYYLAMKCVESLVLNFCAGRPTDSERSRKRSDDGTHRRSKGPTVRGWMV